MNPIWLILLVGGGALYFSKLAKTGNNLSITILNIHTFKIVGGALQIAVNIALDNPTDNSITIKMPYLKAFFNEEEVGNSLPNGERIKVLANSRTVIEKVSIQIPFSNLPGVVMSWFSNPGEKKIMLDIEVSTEVNGIPIKEKKTFSL